MKKRVVVFTVTLLLSVFNFCLAETPYKITDLGIGTATSINNSGKVVGTTWDDFYNGIALLFDTSGQDNHTVLGQGGWTEAWSINNSGQITGRLNRQAVLFDSTGQGNNTFLGALGGSDGCAYAISDAGHIVGGSTIDTSGKRYATSYDASGNQNNINVDPFPISSPSDAIGVNSSNVIVGYSHLMGPVVFDPTGQGNNIYLGTFGGVAGTASSINDFGQIVGYAADSHEPYASRHAALFDSTGNGNNINLGALSGHLYSYAESINSNGQIVGWSYPSLYDSDSMLATLFDPSGNGNNINLNDLISPDSGWLLQRAYDINDSGQIVGRGEINGETHAFLLTPIPEPSTLLLVGIGAVIMRRRK